MGNTIDPNYKSNAPTSAPKSSAFSDATKEVMGKDDFLRLLVTELSNQDPLSPMDNKDMITQMAQFSSLEQMNNVASSMESMSSAFSSLFQHSLLGQGAALIGKYVAGMDVDTENIVEGVVESVQWLDGNPQLVIKKADGTYSAVEMNEIISVADEAMTAESGEPPKDPTDATDPTDPEVPDTGETDTEMQV
ncbi:flagellar hook capping protein [Desulfitobacterium dichloroeliminans LMG P-21439]|uniref:Flagellar hook capping protein n=1 Tax=Desulfitobacterium dichloroeliminans (strain LMG P-21439 / DCA1) TaxID=871963 RepID=L0FB58_DESDL|nr:flagellar hook capping FlgD N-terminal domain-containing protein [Desulfitobacterium dichloroeliminans]AGA70260.1 flagellar hook capping protein [Desulfitobacterium dichloroeliminans LMG P-21439]